MVTMGTKTYKTRGNFHKFAYNLQNGNCKNYSMIKLLCKYKGVGRCQIFQLEKLLEYKIGGLETLSPLEIPGTQDALFTLVFTDMVL